MVAPAAPHRILALVGAAVALALMVAAGPAAGAQKVALTTAEGFPNGRTSGEPPAFAIDGNTSTATWTTEALNTASPAYLAVGFAAAQVTRLRILKDDAGGGGPNAKNLVIQYTNGSGPLASRAWTNVPNLRNGIGGQELLSASSVNASGTVSGDVHAGGYASLSFDPVFATGLRIGFSPPFSGGGCSSNPTGPCNHYHVFELEAWDDAAPSTPVPGQPPIVGPPLYRIVQIAGFPKARMAADASDRDLQTGWVLGAGDRLTVPNALNIGGTSRLRLQKISDGSFYDVVGNTLIERTGNQAFPAIVEIHPSWVEIIMGRVIMRTDGQSPLARSSQRGLAALLTPNARVDGSGGIATVDHFPKLGLTTVANSAGRVTVTPTNRRLRGLQLRRGRQVQVTPTSIGEPFPLVPGGDPAAVNLATIIPSPRVIRTGPVRVTSPSTVSLRGLRRSKCVRTLVVSAKPARVLVTIFSGRRSIRLFGQRLVTFTKAGSRVACILVPKHAKTFDVRTPLRFAVGFAVGSRPRSGTRAQPPVVKPIRLVP